MARVPRPDEAAAAALGRLDPDALASDLADDPARTAFWLNVYNGAVR